MGFAAWLVSDPCLRLAVVPWRTVEDVELATLGWVHWWNTERIHGYLHDRSPDQFEAAYAATRTDHDTTGIHNKQPAQNSEDVSGERAVCV